MKNEFEIVVTEPCSLKWENLTPQNEGRFCGACDKIVIDFTKMSDRELYNYFKRQPEKVCGNFNANQTNRVITSHKKLSNRFWISGIAASMIGFLMSFSSKAQTVDTLKIKQKIEITPITPKSIVLPTPTEITKPVHTDDLIGNPLQGKLGGVCIRAVVIEENKSWKDYFYNRIEDILRHF
ncbi:hypothetical protein Q0590_08785 [Rhodocytophaga aerolata]|uniref:Uncharacterized protein n=1 Tax=Rhodocytophaga aerolata TaxID=455078 RepID=A0ABT8R333_9BACT|nr:hypothetical protein [Rhodocytophaga aerolata]MDO1446344.1 hypothetical protein [Rhodocytophaga aerolata]